MPLARQRSSMVIAEKRVVSDADINIIGVKRRCASSKAKKMPVSGAPVAAPKPAQAPPVII